MDNNKISRRQFLGTAAASVALAAVPGLFDRRAEAAGFRRKKFGPNDTINIGCIGPGGSKGGYRMGLHNAKAAASKPGVRVVAVCDVDEQHLNEAAAEFGPECRKYKDFRELLEQKDIDAVIIGTPDHWHAYQCIAAMKAGKDVYCEKPLTLTIDEGKKLVKVWRQTGAVFQTGSQQRSSEQFRKACELVRNGRIGKLVKVEAHLPTGPIGGPFKVQDVPKDLDWDMWLGPAPMTDYVKERTHGTFRWWLEYSGGMLTDWGAHHNDIAQWGIGMDRSGPISVQAYGRGPLIGENCYNTFPEFKVIYTYENGVQLITTNEGENGVKFIGEEGWIFVNRSKIEASDQKLLDEPLPANAERLYESNDHMANFIDCIRTRKQPICDAEIGHRSVTVCHLANISLKLGGRKLKWDPVKEEFKDCPEANALMSYNMRAPWKV
jgi:predicted dehydrogenase